MRTQTGLHKADSTRSPAQPKNTCYLSLNTLPWKFQKFCFNECVNISFLQIKVRCLALCAYKQDVLITTNSRQSCTQASNGSVSSYYTHSLPQLCCSAKFWAIIRDIRFQLILHETQRPNIKYLCASTRRSRLSRSNKTILLSNRE